MEANNTNKPLTGLEALATKRIKKLKFFYMHSFIFAIGIVFYVLKAYYGIGFNFFSVKYITGMGMCFWTFSYFIQGLDVFVAEVLFGSQWEKRKIDKILEFEESNNQKNK
jgi:hypothetical protein